MRVIAYTYTADIHCPACTGSDLRSGRLRLDNHHTLAFPVNHTGMDEFGIPLNVFDREGNMVHPVFDTDQNSTSHCSDCGGEL